MSATRRLRRRTEARATTDRVVLDFTWAELGIDPDDPERERRAIAIVERLMASPRASAIVGDVDPAS